MIIAKKKIAELDDEFNSPIPEEINEGIQVAEDLIRMLILKYLELKNAYDEREEEYEKLEQAV